MTRRRNLDVTQFVPDDLDLTSDFEKQQLKKPGVVQFSKVSKLVNNRRIKDIIYHKKLDAKLKRQKWENSINNNLRPKTTSYLQKMLNKKVQSNEIERNILLVHQGIEHKLINSKQNTKLMLDLTGNQFREAVNSQSKRTQYQNNILPFEMGERHRIRKTNHSQRVNSMHQFTNRKIKDHENAFKL